jgi:hypothetical protein
MSLLGCYADVHLGEPAGSRCDRHHPPRAFEYLLHRMEPRTVDRRGVPTSIGELLIYSAVKGASAHGSDA